MRNNAPATSADAADDADAGAAFATSAAAGGGGADSGGGGYRALVVPSVLLVLLFCSNPLSPPLQLLQLLPGAVDSVHLQGDNIDGTM